MNRSGNEKRVAVVIPFHKETMNREERIAFDRARDVLGRHDRFMAVPERLNVEEFVGRDPSVRIERFRNEYFESATGYNLMCRKAEFYERFLSYEYMLLYQLDCYVFEDRLLEWCERGYDYVGAPWLDFDFQTQSRKWWVKLPLWRPFLKPVGNGGFSLRHVRRFRDASRSLSAWVTLTRSIPEDVFWSNLACYLYPRLKRAPFKAALAFAFDAQPERCLKLNGGNLPFGCHAWSGDRMGFWRGKITELASTAGRP